VVALVVALVFLALDLMLVAALAAAPMMAAAIERMMLKGL
jgi:hypothetical protein